jgi:hypothetical protein
MIRTVVTTTGRTVYLFTRAGWKFLSKPAEALLLCRMAWWVSVLSITARLCPLPKALQIVSGGSRETAVMPDSNLQKRLAQAIDLLLSADIWIFKPVCWKRAAILHRYLSLNGMGTRIIFGIRNDKTGKVSGHAWVELGGEPILEATPPDYVVTYSFPSKQRFDPKLVVTSG